MDYLDIPRPMSMSERTPSQTNFVIGEEGSEYGDSIGENPNDNENDNAQSDIRYYRRIYKILFKQFQIQLGNSIRVLFLFSWGSLQLWARGLIGSLSALCLSLVVALIVVVIMYSRTFRKCW